MKKPPRKPLETDDCPDGVDILYEQLKMSARIAKSRLEICLCIHGNGSGMAEMWFKPMQIGG